MLVISRKIGETVRIGGAIEVVVLDINAGRVKLGFTGPRNVLIRRGELPAIGEFADSAAAAQALPVTPLANEVDRTDVAPLRTIRKARSRI